MTLKVSNALEVTDKNVSLILHAGMYVENLLRSETVQYARQRHLQLINK